MVYSMTAFSKYEGKYTWGSVTWEIYSLNQRYLDIHINLPKNFHNILSIIRKEIKNVLVRGRLECTATVNMNDDYNHKNFFIDKKLVHHLIKSAKWIKTLVNTGDIDPLKILFWPGVINYEHNILVKEDIYPELFISFKEALSGLIKDREREGICLKNGIAERLNLISKEINKIRRYIPSVLDDKRKKLLEYMQDVCVYTNAIRLEQELLIIAQKIDISEEVDRLISHIKEMNNILSSLGPVGRRLDFMSQELYREANTLASKSINSYIIQLAVSVKLLIEQIREQAQNIE
ncbi:YicC/YloC family endoribonuclease [Candidatus Blochmannia ocreatus (nom. nud.)]|uniref:YicC family protein n=1 Tax=Candidatus Blochmannia ocreatus (nom. nud.) TaxID=251538 RepID=A0ABY4SVP9_9ENTR|nr:YicC/YloC family endoribonuclease [Candidatus Blochmannia ocreatus]URJ25080.1 YicC family protein [Candidatus Blochmannia ocreatus]